ncbi:hypothetical protein [Actinomycetospora termitidis]|uniref:Uncharacterized protein n=1 Tax=Actinomycetospora termitidis TaxID=3053470 RepID=A0ABT7M1K9_9PSEU|nr:hypothetical protein [Actinomycetospora sp. Odt1-22]MDL5154540.1 hypothetical protein [Actinomycetospora sp. Odt1-22]
METVLTLLLVRFAILAAVVAVLVVVGFAVVSRLRRRGQWERTRDRLTPFAAHAADRYGRRPGAGGALARAAARRLDDGRDRR